MSFKLRRTEDSKIMQHKGKVCFTGIYHANHEQVSPIPGNHYSSKGVQAGAGRDVTGCHDKIAYSLGKEAWGKTPVVPPRGQGRTGCGWDGWNLC